MKSLFKKIKSSKDGASTLELALIMPVLLIMIVGALDFGSAFARKMEIANAAKAGIQYALVRKPTQNGFAGIEAAIANNLGDSVNETTAYSVARTCRCDGVAQACSTSCTGGYQSAYITINISENYQTPFFNYSWLMGSFPISEQTTVQLD